MKKLILILGIILILIILGFGFTLMSDDEFSFEFNSEICGDEYCGFDKEAIEEKCAGINNNDVCIISEKWISYNKLKIIGLTSVASGGDLIVNGEASLLDNIITLRLEVKGCEGVCPTLAQTNKVIFILKNVPKDYFINSEIEIV